jgi:hypothetical protein
MVVFLCALFARASWFQSGTLAFASVVGADLALDQFLTGFGMRDELPKEFVDYSPPRDDHDLDELRES